MGRKSGNSKMDCHKTERFLRRIAMLMRLQRIKARMATSSNTTTTSQQRPSDHQTNRALPSNRDRQGSATRSSSSQQPLEATVPSLSSALQRLSRTSIVLHPDRQQRSEASSKRSNRFSHRRRQSEQVRRQLELQASSEQQPTARVRVVAVVLVPHHSGRQRTSGSSRSSSRRRRRRSLNRELGMSSGMPHVLNLVRRMLGRVETLATAPEEDTDANGGRLVLSQAQNERTPEKGNPSGEGDDQKTG